MRRLFFKFIHTLLFGSLVLASKLHANEVIIFDCRRPIAMSDKEKPLKDFYINAGVEMGLKKGVILSVQRRVPLYNTLTNSSAGDLQIQVGRLKLVHVQNRLSVARLVNESTKEELPILEDPYILIGDRIDLGSATAEAEGSEGSAKDTATFAPQESAPVPAPAPVVAPVLEQPKPVAPEATAPTPPTDKTVSVDLKIETLQKPTLLDNKSAERQTATLDNPRLQ